MDRFTPLNLVKFNLITYEDVSCIRCDDSLFVQL